MQINIDMVELKGWLIIASIFGATAWAVITTVFNCRISEAVERNREEIGWLDMRQDDMENDISDVSDRVGSMESRVNEMYADYQAKKAKAAEFKQRMAAASKN